jgi:hypothetical protein
MDTHTNHEIFTGKDLNCGKEIDGLWFSVPAEKVGDAVPIGRWLRYRFSGEYVGHVRLFIFSESLYPCGIRACIISKSLKSLAWQRIGSIYS